MALLGDIVKDLDELLSTQQFKDYCPNGLQVEGSSEINKIVSGVTASLALIDQAVNENADALLVHHGFFWRGESPEIVGYKKQRIAKLIKNDISLLAYHLPLDAHAKYGNNVQLAKMLGLSVMGAFGPEKSPIGILAELPTSESSEKFFSRIEKALFRTPVHLAKKQSKNLAVIAICTGAAQNYFESAIAAGADAFVTGEVSEQTYHLAMESGVDFFAAGHHATERYGVQALGSYLADKFSIAHIYQEIKNPI